jgi:hypothetical protein
MAEIPFGIECFYFFALMQKSNKKINPPRRTKIKELARRVCFFKGSARSDSLDFLTADI